MYDNERIDKTYARRLGEARRGDRCSLSWLLDLEHDWLSSHAERATASKTTRWTARDLVQECCLAVLRAPGTTNAHSRAQFRSWLKTIIRNQVLNELRRLRPGALEEEDDPPVPGSGWDTARTLLWGALPHARIGLAFHFEAALLLRDYCGCSFVTLSSLFESPTRKATYRMRSRAIDSLRCGSPIYRKLWGFRSGFGRP